MLDSSGNVAFVTSGVVNRTMGVDCGLDEDLEHKRVAVPRDLL